MSLLKEHPAVTGHQVVFTSDGCVDGFGGRADERVYAMDALQKVDDRDKDSWPPVTASGDCSRLAWVGSFI